MKAFAQKPNQSQNSDSNPEHLPTKALRANNIEKTEAPAMVHEVLRSPGEPLDSQMRDFMEPRFGHDFSRVRVHSDSQGANSASAVNALAYTAGAHIVFGAGQYSPQTPRGLRLLAHELTHVVQQNVGQASPAIVQRQVPQTPNQEDWNFTPADLTALHQSRGVLRFGPDSAWMPPRIRITLLSALDQMLSTVQHTGIPATTGVSVRDLFHCHVVVPARSRTAAITPDRLRLEQALRAEERQTQQQLRNTDITDANRAEFRRRLEAEQQTATPLLDSVLQMPEAGIVLHSFEGDTSVPSTSPQRNWFANFQTMTARPFEAAPGETGFSSQWSSFMIFNFLIDANGVIHVRTSSTGIQSLSDVTGRSEGGVGGLEREIQGLDQPSIAEQASRREEARQEAQRRESEQPMELGVGNANASGIVYVDSITEPSMWSNTITTDTREPANSFHEPLRPPNFILSAGRRFNLMPNHRVRPRRAR